MLSDTTPPGLHAQKPTAATDRNPAHGADHMSSRAERGDHMEVVPAEALTVINAKCEIKRTVRQRASKGSSYPKSFESARKTAGVLYLQYYMRKNLKIWGILVQSTGSHQPQRERRRARVRRQFAAVRRSASERRSPNRF